MLPLIVDAVYIDAALTDSRWSRVSRRAAAPPLRRFRHFHAEMIRRFADYFQRYARHDAVMPDGARCYTPIDDDARRRHHACRYRGDATPRCFIVDIDAPAAESMPIRQDTKRAADAPRRRADADDDAYAARAPRAPAQPLKI